MVMQHPWLRQHTALFALYAIPAFRDNYIWAIAPHHSQELCLIDPGSAQPARQLAADLQRSISHILITHCHPDHIGGVAELMQHGNIQLFTPAHETYQWQFPQQSLAQHQDISSPQADDILIGPLRVQVLQIPGHTQGHIGYWLTAATLTQGETAQFNAGEEVEPSAQRISDTPHSSAPTSGWLFCGDTVFSAGCGRVFDGSLASLYQSLRQIADLPNISGIAAGQIYLCCAHEYTLSNLNFAALVEPNNQDRVQYQRSCEAKRQLNVPTLPTTLAQELAINPFLRTEQLSLQQLWQQPSGFSLFSYLREWKNQA